jgi:hypothetical protein
VSTKERSARNEALSDVFESVTGTVNIVEERAEQPSYDAIDAEDAAAEAEAIRATEDGLDDAVSGAEAGGGGDTGDEAA